MSMVVGLEGRPLRRDEERRIAAPTTERQPGSRSLGTARRDTILNPMAEFTALFVLGMLGGSAAVFIALFML
jgi:hypothetical protein